MSSPEAGAPGDVEVVNGRIDHIVDPDVLADPGATVRRVDTFYRLLLTGSRDFGHRGPESGRDPVRDPVADRATVRGDLLAAQRHWGCRADQIVVVQGMARGLDQLARAEALDLGMRVEDHPVTDADWERYGKSAGHRRNGAMVAAGARGCIAYPLGESRGTRGCMALCAAAGIPVWNRTDPCASTTEAGRT